MRAPPLRRAQLDISHEPRSHQRRNLRGGDTNGRFCPGPLPYPGSRA